MATVDMVSPGMGGMIPVAVFSHCMRVLLGNANRGVGRVEALTVRGWERHVEGVLWLDGTMDAVCALPWRGVDNRDGRKPLDAGAVVDLLVLLPVLLEDSTLPPTSVIPTWRGGVTFEWHVNGFDLEISSDPDGTKTYFFVGPGVPESEGVLEDGIGGLKEFVRSLPACRS